VNRCPRGAGFGIGSATNLGNSSMDANTTHYRSIESLGEFIQKCPCFGEAVESLGARIGIDRAVVAGHAAIMASNYCSIGTLVVTLASFPPNIMRDVQTGMKMFIVHGAGVDFNDFSMLVKLLHTDGAELARQRP